MHYKVLFIWGTCVVAGLAVMANYQTTPGANGAIPKQWPHNTTVIRDPSRLTLIMFAHPHCPCTRASIDELAGVMTQSNGRLDGHVVFVRPETVPTGWEVADNWEAATEIPGVHVSCDSGGVDARRFGVRTSGHVLLYDPQGKLVFQGGITPSRGHSGDNAGAAAAIAAINGESPSCDSTPVFGCPLFDP